MTKSGITVGGSLYYHQDRKGWTITLVSATVCPPTQLTMACYIGFQNNINVNVSDKVRTSSSMLAIWFPSNSRQKFKTRTPDADMYMYRATTVTPSNNWIYRYKLGLNCKYMRKISMFSYAMQTSNLPVNGCMRVHFGPISDLSPFNLSTIKIHFEALSQPSLHHQKMCMSNDAHSGDPSSMLWGSNVVHSWIPRFYA